MTTRKLKVGLSSPLCENCPANWKNGRKGGQNNKNSKDQEAPAIHTFKASQVLTVWRELRIGTSLKDWISLKPLSRLPCEFRRRGENLARAHPDLLSPQHFNAVPQLRRPLKFKLLGGFAHLLFHARNQLFELVE